VTGLYCPYTINILRETETLISVSGQVGVPLATNMTADLGVIQALHQVAIAGELTLAEADTLGALLYEHLLPSGARDVFLQRYRSARDQHALLPIKMVINGASLPGLAALPWEFTAVPADEGADWFSTAEHLSFSRALSSNSLVWSLRTVAPGTPMRLVLAVSAPEQDDEGNELGEVAYEGVKNALDALQQSAPDRFQVHLVKPATADSVYDALKRYKPSAFHFIGHGRLAEYEGAAIGQIALEGELRGVGRWVPSDEFSRMFSAHVPDLVVLQACESAAAPASQAFLGIAQRVVQQGVPLVVAMQYRIENYAARLFAEQFYRQIADGSSVDRAVQVGRAALSRQTPAKNAAGAELHTGFATPVLFRQVEDAHLFASDAVARVALQAGATATPAPLAAVHAAAAELADLLRSATWSVDDARRAYFATVPDQPDFRDGLPLGDDSGFLTECLARLATAPVPADMVPPLLRFAARLHGASVDPGLNDKLENWCRRTAQTFGIAERVPHLLAEYADCEDSATEYWSLIVKIQPTSSDTCKIEAWLLGDEPEQTRALATGDDAITLSVGIGSTGRVIPGLDAVLRDMLVRALDQIAIDAHLVVEFVLPNVLLWDDAAAYPFIQGTLPRLIGRAHPVVVRSLNRMYDGSMRLSRADWARKWSVLKLRQSEAGEHTIRWIERSEDLSMSRLVETLDRPDVTFVGLEVRPAREVTPEQDPLAAVLSLGLPAAVWPATADAISDRHAFRDLIVGKPLGELPDRLYRLRQNGSSPAQEELALMWDNFDRKPPDVDSFLRAPARLGRRA
jgi:vWA-MoxR associated protein C-terminal domain/CHAT domain